MRRLIAVGVLTAIILSICIIGAYKINSIYDEMNGLVDICENSEESELTTNADTLVESAEKYDTVLTFFVRRNVVENISESAKRLTALSKDVPSYMAECKSIRHYLNEMKEEYTISLKSIL